MSDIYTDRGLATGAVALISAPDSDLLMPAVAMAFAEDRTVSVVPVTSEVRHATEWDLFLDASVLGYGAVAEVWNYGSSQGFPSSSLYALPSK